MEKKNKKEDWKRRMEKKDGKEKLKEGWKKKQRKKGKGGKVREKEKEVKKVTVSLFRFLSGIRR